MKEINLAVFASGAGSNAQAIINYFQGHALIKTSLIITTNPQAGVVIVGEKYHIPVKVFGRQEWSDENTVTHYLDNFKIDYLILAGFLKLIPDFLITKYCNKILNIHPSLLPMFGGVGMYGDFVHQAVFDSLETETGVTIHIVDNQYDNGDIVFQKKCKVSVGKDTVEDIKRNVRSMELHYYPRVIESFVMDQLHFK
ncbi:MAG: phosphoribosylglycinamide formyltransferase [Bacteroidota bacterium]|nr:phosphoribosylglycinamide formyltransferase [Bacteroidota bacterium]